MPLPKQHKTLPKPAAILGKAQKPIGVKRHAAFVQRKPINMIRFRLAQAETEDDCNPMPILTEDLEVTEAGAGSIRKGTKRALRKGLLGHGFVAVKWPCATIAAVKAMRRLIFVSTKSLLSG